MNDKHYFTAREVDALIPQLEQLLEHVRICTTRAEELAARSLRADEIQEQVLRSQVQFLMQLAEDDIDAIAKLGGVTKDIETGLVDFLGEVNGRDVWLCWRKGERAVRFYHAMEGGFNQRKPLTPTVTRKIH